SRGVVVVEAAGDRRRDLDALEDNRGKRTLNRRHHDFLDSGAIVVGAAESLVPYGRLEASNHGSRVGCYAWGEKAVTSSAAAVVAGAAVAVQGVAQQNLGFRFGPRQLRLILSSPAYGTVAMAGAGIGV